MPCFSFIYIYIYFWCTNSLFLHLQLSIILQCTFLILSALCSSLLNLNNCIKYFFDISTITCRLKFSYVWVKEWDNNFAFFVKKYNMIINSVCLFFSKTCEKQLLVFEEGNVLLKGYCTRCFKLDCYILCTIIW